MAQMNVGIIGSCLSNLSAVFLVSDFNFQRLNNAAIGRSDQFVERYIDGTVDLPPLDEMARLLDFPTDDPNPPGMRYLLENYRDRGGLTELDPSLPSLHRNLTSGHFDLLLLDNLVDVAEARLVWNVDGRELKFTFPLAFAGPNSAIHKEAVYTAPLSVEESVENWAKIVQYLQRMQPHARIIFLATQYATSRSVPERAARAEAFYELFRPRAQELGIQLIAPLDPDVSLTKLPDDWTHFDMKVYRGLAGYIYTSMTSGWAMVPAPDVGQKAASSKPKLREWHPAPSLTGVIADLLGLPHDRVDEASGLDRTENWDSLKQVEIMTKVEAAFGVRVAFNETMETSTVGEIRALLARRGIAAADDADHVEHISARFVARALETPTARFVKFAKAGIERDLTFGDMLAGIETLLDELQGLERGSIVAIVMDHSEHLYTSFIGCLLGGFLPTMLPPLTRKQDPAVFKDSMAVLFDRLAPAAVITVNSMAAHIPASVSGRIIRADELADKKHEGAPHISAPPPPVPRHALAFLQHSSGTTGYKKGVMLNHAQVYEQARLYADSIGMKTGDVVCSWLPLYHDMGLLTSFIIPTIVGCPIVSIDAIEWSASPTMLLDQLEREKGAFAWLPNFAFHHIARAHRDEREWDLRSVKAIISCSEPCRMASLESFSERFGTMGCGMEKLRTSYAMAENVFAVTQSAPDAPPRLGDGELDGYVSSGKLLAGVEIEIRLDGRVLGDGELGDIWLRTTTMFSGYFKLPDLTQERVIDGWYNTRDLGCIVDGELFVRGRTDDVIIVNGKNVVAHEIEDQLNNISAIAPGRILISSRYDSQSASEELIVMAEPLDATAGNDDLELDIRERVFSLCGVTPRKVRVLPKGFLIKSTAGKISRAASLKKFAAQYEAP